jgi:high affinity Mn2+ porin
MRVRLALVLLAALPLSVAAQPAEQWNVHGQSTYVWQTKPAFNARYDGLNSLSTAAEKSYSFTATAALGLRLGPDTELYFDPELSQGVALSGLVGLSGFTNGELAKTSGANPTLYRARLFVRHTIGLGGERTAVESASNQLAGQQNSRRVVLTAGALSLLDLFDANRFAHDPRTQFMNWALMTHAAYDFAADSRGYTYGVAAEYFGDGWSARAGRFALPREPNGLPLDGRLGRHFGDQAEVTRDYRLGSQSGTARLLVFRTRAVLAAYADALDAVAGTGTVPSLEAVRTRDHSKSGIGLSVDHKAGDDLGLFARVMRSDGRTETDAFTESDRSISLGMALAGGRWQRALDTVGVAFAASGLSPGHRAFLASGGQTVFLGDGRLRYAPERVFEAYYSVALNKQTSLTADYQRISNPGFNADRGPASFYALRLHWEN